MGEQLSSPGTARRNRPYAPRMNEEERREHVLDAALRVIVSQGVHKVSMDSVAKEAGVTRPVVYGVFKDANALLRASLDREDRLAREQMTALLPLIVPGDPAASAVACLDGFLRAVLAAPDRWRAIFSLVDSATPAFRKRVERYRRTVIGVVEQALNAADVEPDADVELLARTLYALLWSSGREALAEPDRFPPERITAFGARLLPALLGAGGTGQD